LHYDARLGANLPQKEVPEADDEEEEQAGSKHEQRPPNPYTMYEETYVLDDNIYNMSNLTINL
jgi:hypothetical protein